MTSSARARLVLRSAWCVSLLVPGAVLAHCESGGDHGASAPVSDASTSSSDRTVAPPRADGAADGRKGPAVSDGGAAPSDSAARPDADAGLGSFTGRYYANANLTGAPVLTRTDDAINFRFGYGDPGVASSPDPIVPASNWSAQWDGRWTFANAGAYKFYATTTNGVRVSVDGEMVIGSWQDQPESSYVTPVTLAAGVHDIHVEYYTDSTQAAVVISWAVAPQQLLALEKQAGCYANGVLWGGPDEVAAWGRAGDPDLSNLQASVASSSCTLLLRAGETWDIPPDYATVQQRMSTLQALAGTKRFVYGLYVAEELLPSYDSYTDSLTGQSFVASDFANMCVPGSAIDGSTCASSLRSQTYQEYVASITERGLDLGFTDFLFGALENQESVQWSSLDGGGPDDTWETAPIFPRAFARLRAYAFAKGTPITIGCQMIPPSALAQVRDGGYATYTHLALCDYKYSPLLTSVVTASQWDAGTWDDPASADWSNGDWNTPAITNQTSVLADFENWGPGDDVDLYDQQQKPDRDLFAFNAYAMLEASGQGLLMPFLEPLSTMARAQCPYPTQPDGTDPQYAPSDKYCGDEEAMNAAMAGSPIYITADQHYVQSGGSTMLRWHTPTPNTCGVWADGYELWLNGDYGDTSTYGPLTSDSVYTLECPDGTTATTTVHVVSDGGAP